MADDDIANELSTHQDADETLIDSESEGDKSSEARAGDDALVTESAQIRASLTPDDPINIQYT
ncbi:MAG: hypothetical protein EBW42_07110, partial [Rhodobacterales bacterium]|nr:hypothetical protein [Rhodobacterales bacterium]